MHNAYILAQIVMNLRGLNDGSNKYFITHKYHKIINHKIKQTEDKKKREKIKRVEIEILIYCKHFLI